MSQQEQTDEHKPKYKPVGTNPFSSITKAQMDAALQYMDSQVRADKEASWDTAIRWARSEGY
jgi:hypothetical protein